MIFPVNKRRRTGLLMASVLLIVAGILIWMNYGSNRVRTEKDIYLLTARFRDYNWSDNGKGSTLSFKIYDYKEKFYVKPEFLSGLNGGAFRNTNMGDSVTIGIPAYALPYLNTRQKRIPVYSIQVKGQTLLEATYTLKKNSDNNLLIAALMVLAAGGVFYWMRKQKTV